MQPATTERRNNDATRIPIDLWIRLAHEDYEEPFDADGVDLSTRGLAMRSDYLPEVGDRLRCSFDCPPFGDEIAVDGEVVWAHDAGDRSGEFGLRFDPVGEEIEESLRAMVQHLGGEAAATVARLHLDGVASPIEAEILERDARWLTVEQELPFLQVGMGVSIENGGSPRGRLASVDLRIENGTPRLVLSVELDEAREDADAEPAGAIDDGFVEESTFDDEPAQAGAAETLDEVDGSDATVQDYELPEELAEAVDGAAPIERDDVQVFAVSERDDDAWDDEARDAIAPTEDEAPGVDRMAQLKAALRPVAAKAREQLATAGAKVRPALSAAWAKVVVFASLVASKAGPMTKALFARVKALLAKALKRGGKRRTTAAPPKRVAGVPRRRQVAEAEAPAPKRSGRRILILSVLAFVGVGAALFALTGGDEEAPEAEPQTVVLPATNAAPAPIEAAPEPAPEPIDDAPAADEAPAPEGGRLGEPSFPSLQDADPASAPVTEGQTFGAASVSDGRSATIRMSQPVTTLRGQPLDDGFTVTVPGALALDRAAPIAAANPSIERAMILNRGDHAVLTIRFVAGRTPPYRVAARGRAIEIVIGR